MNERDYHYQIIRYVADLRRMEPQNIGVIVQSDAGVTCRLWTHFDPGDRKPDFDHANYRKWREFFVAEVNGPQIALFHPSRETPAFLDYLQTKCQGNYTVTRPLHVAMQSDSLSEVRDHLYDMLVKRPEEEAEPAEQPVRRFREELQARKLDRHPLLKRDEYIALPQGDPVLFHWQYHENHGADREVLIDPVQWMGRIRLTQMELEHALYAVRRVREAKLRADLFVVMDDVEPPSDQAKDSTKRLYDNYLRSKREIEKSADIVANTLQATESLVDKIEKDLKGLLHSR